ncbi:MAG: M1 family peptidase, partial [Flavobacterium sp.]
HTLRQVVNNDEKWRAILRGLNENFYHQTVTTQQIENYLSENIGQDLTPVFDQYLRDTRIPMLEYFFKENVLGYRWSNCVTNFKLPVKVFLNGIAQNLKPTNHWQEMPLKTANPSLEVDKNYYVGSFNITE